MAIDKAVTSLVAERLGKDIRNEVQALINKAIDAALDDVREHLLVKLVSQGNHAFTVEFAWKSQHISQEDEK